MKLDLSDLPNAISLGRILLTIPVVFMLLERRFTMALFLFALAGASDALDGHLAKRFGWQSRLGGILDPLADKALLMSAFLVLGAIGLIPVWLVVAAVCRDLLIVGGALVYHYQVEDLDATPTWASKLNTLLQILLLIAVMANAGPLLLPSGSIEALVWMTLTTTLLSGFQYVWIWSRKAKAQGWRRDCGRPPEDGTPNL